MGFIAQFYNCNKNLTINTFQALSAICETDYSLKLVSARVQMRTRQSKYHALILSKHYFLGSSVPSFYRTLWNGTVETAN